MISHHWRPPSLALPRKGRGERGLVQAVWLGRVGYDAAHKVQVALRDQLIAGRARPTVLLLEHDPVITVGRRGEMDDLCLPPQELERRGVACRRTERGGRATYHGPGQLVLYPIAPVRWLARDLTRYVCGLEDTIIRSVARLGLAASRHPAGRGVWVGDSKLASVGIAVTHGVCWHGIALNVDPDLSGFDLVRACGLETPVTSVARCLGSAPAVRTVAELAVEEFAVVFEVEAEWADLL